MKIDFRKFDGKSDESDPKTGSPISVTSESFLALIRGKTVNGVSGIYPGTEVMTISFSDNSLLWFVTTKGIPRILYQEKS